MRKPRLKPPVRRTRRRWRVPPAITHGGEAFEGLGILDEVPGRLGLIFWQSVRDVALWASVPEESREGLFAEGAEERRRAALRSERVSAALEGPLSEMAELLGHPNATTGELVARACHQVVEWADSHDLTGTALAFVQAAAFAAPADAATAYDVARLARMRAEDARAESWYRRTIALARQSGDWQAYAMAFLGLGNLYVQRGNLPVARRLYVRALRAARRHSLHAVAGTIFHDLFLLAVAAGRPEEAERAARGACEEYGPEHPRFPALARDVAYNWMEQGYCARALPVFRALLPHLGGADDRLVARSCIGRAAAGVGDRDTFEAAWSAVWERAGRDDARVRAADAFLELAYGAARLGDWARADEAARQALELAALHDGAKVHLAAEGVLEAVRERRGAQRTATEPEPAASKEADVFAEDLVRSLSQRIAAG